jgi:hypothetical protein
MGDRKPSPADVLRASGLVARKPGAAVEVAGRTIERLRELRSASPEPRLMEEPINRWRARDTWAIRLERSGLTLVLSAHPNDQRARANDQRITVRARNRARADGLERRLRFWIGVGVDVRGVPWGPRVRALYEQAHGEEGDAMRFRGGIPGYVVIDGGRAVRAETAEEADRRHRSARYRRRFV